MGNTFAFDGQELGYFRHPYNRAGLNMRTVEVPIALEFLRGHEGDRILEFGNVLVHYYEQVWWPVLDIRERGAINEDVMRWEPGELFDRIVSISTLEHVGHGRFAHLTTPGTTPARVIERMRGWLAPGGEALYTVPLRYNAALDQELAAGELPVERALFMRLVDARNRWEQCDMAEALAATKPAGYRWPAGMAALYCQNGGALDTLNLGAGKRPLKGAVNHDRRLDPARPWITVAHDLNERPWPWQAESFDRIVARAVLEHLNIDLVQSLDECWRLLRPQGTLYIKLPFWMSELAHSDPTHRWFFTLRSFDQFDPARRRGREYDFYTDRHWKIIKGPKLNAAKSSIHVLMEVRK